MDPLTTNYTKYDPSCKDIEAYNVLACKSDISHGNFIAIFVSLILYMIEI